MEKKYDVISVGSVFVNNMGQRAVELTYNGHNMILYPDTINDIIKQLNSPYEAVDKSEFYGWKRIWNYLK